jgi:hypothetical protein
LVGHLKALTRLQSLALTYSNGVVQRSSITNHAAVWSRLLALKHLDLEVWTGDEDNSLSVGIAAGIARATSLTRPYCWFWGGADTGADLANMLAPLKQLQSLEFCLRGSRRFEFGDLLSSSLAGLQRLSMAVGEFRSLALLQLCYKARQLTQLVLEHALVSDDQLEVIARNIAGLQQLALCSCTVSTAGVVEALTLPNLPNL